MKKLQFKTALLADGWAEDVVIEIDNAGTISAIHAGTASNGRGCAIPGMANLHSHAHQRAMAGLAEKSGAGDDSFWTWRKTMYQFLAAITPEHLNAIAAQLYLEMLKAGYTRVAEFQYLHHQRDGTHYQNIAEMSLQTMQAAQATGIGITNLPVHYQFSGFAAQPATEQQQRFVCEPQDFLSLVESIKQAAGEDKNIVTGMAGHSLRAVTKESFNEVLLESRGAPVHIHVAEQVKEVEDCLAWSGARPVEYLFENFAVDDNWCLIHATHMSDAETLQLASSGAVAGLCPTTEANLGDGLFNAPDYLAAGGKFGLGSDSHISVSPTEELRWLEYGQRLWFRSRNQLSLGNHRSTGRTLFDLAAAGGARACGHNSGSLAVGQRADIVVLDIDQPALCERVGDEILDSWIFSGNTNSVRDVYVGGRQVIEDGHHAKQHEIGEQFKSTIRKLRT